MWRLPRTSIAEIRGPGQGIPAATRNNVVEELRVWGAPRASPQDWFSFSRTPLCSPGEVRMVFRMESKRGRTCGICPAYKEAVARVLSGFAVHGGRTYHRWLAPFWFSRSSRCSLTSPCASEWGPARSLGRPRGAVDPRDYGGT